jgi:type VI secretion system protein ImpB
MVTATQGIKPKPARINIILDLVKNGAKRQQELPLKLLVLGDFSAGQATQAIGQRRRLAVTSANIDQTMAYHQPKVSFSVHNHLQAEAEPLPVELTFHKFADFQPQNIIEQVPVLKQLMAMRHLLKDLKANLSDNQTLRKQLNTICLDERQTRQLQQELQQTAPLA